MEVIRSDTGDTRVKIVPDHARSGENSTGRSSNQWNRRVSMQVIKLEAIKLYYGLRHNQCRYCFALDCHTGRQSRFYPPVIKERIGCIPHGRTYYIGNGLYFKRKSNI